MTATPRFALPYLFPAQAQKEHFHNEALAVLDMAMHPVVIDTRGVAPTEVTIGQSWIVADGAVGAWAGHEQAIACWTSGGWRFVAPVPGMWVWSVEGGRHLSFGSQGWTAVMNVEAIAIDGAQIVGPRQPDIPSPSAGTTIDAQARAAIDGIIATLKTHGLID